MVHCFAAVRKREGDRSFLIKKFLTTKARPSSLRHISSLPGYLILKWPIVMMDE